MVKQAKTTITKAEKKDAVKALFRELLQEKSYKRTALIEAAAVLYAQRFPDKDTENVNDVKGRVGSVFDIMKKDGEIVLDGGMYVLKTKIQDVPPIEEPEKHPPKKVVKKQAGAGKKRTAAKKDKGKEKDEPILPVDPVLPMVPVNPNYPTDPIAPAILPIPADEPKKDKEEKEKASKKRLEKTNKKPPLLPSGVFH